MIIFEGIVSIIKDYFHFNKRQERGVFVLAVIIIIMIVLNHYAPYFSKRSAEELEDSKAYLQQLKLVAYEEKLEKKSYKSSYKEKKIKNVELLIQQNFDPNTISLELLLEMGLPVYVANNIDKYRSKGGRFYQVEDIRKIYGMNEYIADQMIPWIEIARPREELKEKPKEEKIEVIIKEESKERELLKLGINSSDSIELLQVSGIGPFYAGAIVKYRKQLGGFIQLDQLMELYKMDSTKYCQMTRELFLDSLPPKKIELNTADFKTILRHPYFDYETTKYIVNKRNKLGKYSALYQLKDDKKLPSSQFEKILPYIKLD